VERPLDAPPWDWGSAQQCADFLGIERSAFEARVDEGAIPPGDKWNKKNVVWHWRVIAAVGVLSRWLLERNPLPTETPQKKSQQEKD
jgi:hypothetical protein